jgi:hypothetical protein
LDALEKTMALVVLITLCALILIGGITLIVTFADDWQGIRQLFEKNTEVKKEKLRLKHELEMQKLRLEHERDQAYAGALGRSGSEDAYRELGLLDGENDGDNHVENKE